MILTSATDTFQLGKCSDNTNETWRQSWRDEIAQLAR